MCQQIWDQFWQSQATSGMRHAFKHFAFELWFEACKHFRPNPVEDPANKSSNSKRRAREKSKESGVRKDSHLARMSQVRGRGEETCWSTSARKLLPRHDPATVGCRGL